LPYKTLFCLVDDLLGCTTEKRTAIDVHDFAYENANMAETVRIEARAHAALVEIARVKDISLTEALSRAVEMYRRELFLKAFNDGYDKLRADREAWAEEQNERDVWDSTSSDGLIDH